MDNQKAREYEVLTITRLLDATKDEIWDAWTIPEQFAEWWSPDYFTIPVCELDVKPEGKLRVDMKGPDGTIYPSVGVYKEVIKPEKLSFINSPLDNDGNKLFEVLQTIELTGQGDKTLLTISSEVISSTPAAEQFLAGMEQGVNQALQKLDQYLKES